MKRALLVLVSCFILSVCGVTPSQAPSFGSEPLLTLVSASGLFSVELRTSPQPPVRGLVEVELKLTRAEGGSAVDSAEITVIPWMVKMGHGTSVTPEVINQGGGTYRVKNVYLYMAGDWTLRTTFSGLETDTIAPTFAID